LDATEPGGRQGREGPSGGTKVRRLRKMLVLS
jgi:hypothetical protein